MKIDPPKVESIIIKFIKEKLNDRNSVVLGVSGGIDSAVVLALCVRALGRDRVLPIWMPMTKVDYNKKLAQVKDLCKVVGSINPTVVFMRNVLDELCQVLSPVSHESLGVNEKIGYGNLQSRLRMTVLYWYANTRNLFVVGTSNRTEILLGYFTKYGDGASDINPIGGLYKNQVKQLAIYLRVPDSIINKPPSADLWEGQTDEEEIGLDYDSIDLILYHHEHNYNSKEISIKTEIPIQDVEQILERKKSNTHKCEAIPSPNIIEQ
jgi:NAD+ synthase